MKKIMLLIILYIFTNFNVFSEERIIGIAEGFQVSTIGDGWYIIRQHTSKILVNTLIVEKKETEGCFLVSALLGPERIISNIDGLTRYISALFSIFQTNGDIIIISRGLANLMYKDFLENL